MTIRIAHESRNKSIRAPCVGHGPRPEPQGCDTGKGPDRLDHRDKSAFVKNFADVGKKQEENNMADAVGDNEEVRGELCMV